MTNLRPRKTCRWLRPGIFRTLAFGSGLMVSALVGETAAAVAPTENVLTIHGRAVTVAELRLVMRLRVADVPEIVFKNRLGGRRAGERQAHSTGLLERRMPHGRHYRGSPKA